jgi:two-component system LytT family sensor kinase
MKIRWRTHERILVTVFAVFILVIYLLRLHFIPPAQRNEIYATPFLENHASFNYYHNILLLQLLILLIQYGCYHWLNWLIIPPTVSIVKGKGKKNLRVVSSIGVVLQVIFIIYLLGPVSNFIFYYLSRFSVHPGILISFFPRHPQPLANTFGGFYLALLMVGIYLTYATVREVVIHFLERPGSDKNYKALVCNQVTIFTVLYLSLYPLLHWLIVFRMPPGDGRVVLRIFFLIIPSLLLAFGSNIYWLFPISHIVPSFKPRTLLSLLLLTCICTLPVLIGKPNLFFAVWAIQLLVVTPLSWLVYQQKKDQLLQLRGIEKALVQSTADLQLLRSQINPHFLFNALNTLYGTALREKSPDTASAIQQLGDMMRFMLHDNNQDFIPLAKEIAYLKNYISLQALRIPTSPQIAIEYHIDEEDADQQIAPMLLIPFVENAFKYGISLKDKSWVRISFTCDDNTIQFKVANSVHQLIAQHPEKEQSGIGLKNVTERLQWTYPGKHLLTIHSNEQEFKVKLQIEL